MPILLLASNNPGKIKEMSALLAALDLMLVTPAQTGLALRVEESGQTYAENAALKAIAYARATGLLTMADDSGLEVEVLGGAPGLHSARYAPQPGATDAQRRSLLLEKLAAKPRPWKARFCCVMALVSPPEDKVYYAEGICAGEIVPEERGENGFGYDPIFLVAEMGRTMAELSLQEKNRLSHRARAVRAAYPILLDLLSKLS
jgi:XTP/dITP diphosphohydrolase